MSKEDLKEVLGVIKDSELGKGGCHHQDGDCCCPVVVVYLVYTDCVTINNGACADWSFCVTGHNTKKK